jgi:ATP-dependent DNA helicase RecG
MRSNGSPDPVFETDENNHYFLAKLPIHPAFVGDNVARDVVKDVVKELSERQKVILELMRENDRISAMELSQKVGVTQRTIQREIAKLTEMGCISRIDGRKIGYWKVIE